MRIGVTGFGPTTEKLIRQAERAEADGFASLWAPSSVVGDPLVALALAARATERLEVGTAVLQTYAAHPSLMAARAASVADAIGEPGRFTLGIGPSHRPVIEDLMGLSYDRPGLHTDEYVRVVTSLLRGQPVAFAGDELSATAGPPPLVGGAEIPVLVSALAPRLLRVAGENAAGTITWMANARAVGEHVAPLLTRAADTAGRPAPRIVVGLPVVVHDDVDAARAVAAEQFTVYGTLPNYLRIMERGGISAPAEAAIVGDEASVAEQLTALFDAGATDVWAAPFAVGDDLPASRARTRALLKDLAA